MIFPNTIIAGAPKCGTSSLYFWLAAHPDACASKAKETFFFADEVSRFNKGLNFNEHGIEAYTRHFEHCRDTKVIFEATAPYIYYKTALREIPNLPTDPKVIFILREPAARLYSKFKFNKYKLKNFQGSFAEYCSLDGAFGSGRHFEEGRYIDYLQPWQEVLGRHRMKIVFFEDLLKDKVKGMSDLADYLGLDATFYENFDFLQRNETVKLKSTRLHRLGLRLQPFIPFWVQNTLLPIYMRLNSGSMPGKTAEEKALVAQLKELYAPLNKRLFEDLGVTPLTSWK